jgi:hypothetical protein
LSNVYFARFGTWQEYTGHFWSLAIEEQFYLAWPLIVLTTPRRWLGPLIATLDRAQNSGRPHPRTPIMRVASYRAAPAKGIDGSDILAKAKIALEGALNHSGKVSGCV